MRIKPGIAIRRGLLISLMMSLTLLSTRIQADTGTCGGASTRLPFTDVAGSNVFFCSIAEAYFSGLTNGTSATTYSPGSAVSREQMAAFVTRTLDQSLKRGSKRAALDQNWTTRTADDLALTTVGRGPEQVKSDGADLWVANNIDATVSRVRASDGKLLETWTGARNASGVLIARGKVFVTGTITAVSARGALYQIDPTQPAGPVTTLSSALGEESAGIAYDGQRIWTANIGLGDLGEGSVSIITLDPVTVNNVSTGFSLPKGIVYDGANIWVTDVGDNKLKKLDSNGNILMSISMGSGPSFPVFDGTNIWVPNETGEGSVTVVRAIGGLSGTVLATLRGNGLDFNFPTQAAFDGERILVTNRGGDSVSLWKASDFTPIGTFPTGTGTKPYGACSDGINFWITLKMTFHPPPNKLARF